MSNSFFSSTLESLIDERAQLNSASAKQGNHLKEKVGEYDNRVNKERVKDIEKAVKQNVMGSVVINISGLVETVFSHTVFKRLRGEHDPIRLANDPKFPGHKDVPLDEPNEDAAEDVVRSDDDTIGKATAPSAPSNPGVTRDRNRQPDPELPRPPPCPIIDEVFKKLSTGKGKLYANGEWSGWPDTSKPDIEKKVCEYLNKILAKVCKYLHGPKGHKSRPEWVFSPRFATKEMKLDEVARKPDIILIRSGNSGAARWQLVRSAGEIRSSRYETERQLAEGRLAQYSRLMYGDDCARRFVLLFSLIKDEMALFRYDRAGVLVSRRFSVHKDPKNFLRVILGLGLAEDYFVGLDPSFFFKGLTRFVRLNDKEYEIIEPPLHPHSVIRGRGTVALRVIIEPESRKEGVIKDQWVDKARYRQEFFWLLYLAAHGAKNIATLEDHQLVRFQVGEDITVDETSALRALISGWDMDGIETRDHRRVLVTPAGEPLKHFRSLKELISVFKDYAEAILSVYRAKVFHRDISRRNLVIYRESDDAIGKGYVIDFDCAAFRKHHRCGVAEITGTVPFMAISILEKNGCPHKYYYELESLFHTLVWMCLTASERKYDGCPIPVPVFRRTPLCRWCGPKINDPEDEEDVFKDIAHSKSAVLTSDMRFKNEILSRLPPYFAPICDTLEKLRNLLFRPEIPKDITRAITLSPEHMRVQHRKDEEIVLQTVINIFDEALKDLETNHAEQVNSFPASAKEQHTEGLAEDPDMERAANRRMRQVRGQKGSTPPEDNPADEAELENAGNDSSEGDTPYNFASPTPRPTKVRQPVDSLVLSIVQARVLRQMVHVLLSRRLSQPQYLPSQRPRSP